MEKIKHFIGSEQGKDILVVIIVILVGLGSFALGRLSIKANPSTAQQENESQDVNQPASVVSGMDLITNTDETAVADNSNSKEKNFFASSRGSKYYPVGCSTGKTIKQENRIYFTTGEEAQTAGYTLSSACK
jgi:hypothetical protein